jgi:hypothetical protein
MLGFLMQLMLSSISVLFRMLAVSSQPEKSPHHEMLADTKQDTELSAPPRPGIDQLDANCTLPYTGNLIFIVHCMRTRWQQLLVALLTSCALENKEEWSWNGVNQQRFAYS